VIAQDIQKVYPELVQETKRDYLSVDYPKFTAVFIQAIKEQQKEIELLKASQSDAKFTTIRKRKPPHKIRKIGRNFNKEMKYRIKLFAFNYQFWDFDL